MGWHIWQSHGVFVGVCTFSPLWRVVGHWAVRIWFFWGGELVFQSAGDMGLKHGVAVTW